jgi:hypothetical protein
MTKTKIQIQRVPLEELMRILPPEVLKTATQHGKAKKKKPTAVAKGAKVRSKR